MKTFQYSISFNLTLSEYLALSPSPRSEPVGRWRKTEREWSRAEVVTIDSISSIEEPHKTWSSCVQPISNIIVLYVSNDSQFILQYNKEFFRSFFYDSALYFTIKCKMELSLLWQYYFKKFRYNQHRIECTQSVFQLSMKSCEKVNYGSNNKINSYSIIYMGGLQSYNDWRI